jgi:hypothetical protein
LQDFVNDIESCKEYPQLCYVNVYKYALSSIILDLLYKVDLLYKAIQIFLWFFMHTY